MVETTAASTTSLNVVLHAVFTALSSATGTSAHANFCGPRHVTLNESRCVTAVASDNNCERLLPFPSEPLPLLVPLDCRIFSPMCTTSHCAVINRSTTLE